MGNKPLRYFLAGETCLFLGILINIFLLPDGLSANDGISYYSARSTTALPYLFGLLGAAWFSIKLVRSLPSQSHTMVKVGFLAIALLLLAIAVAPYGISSTFEYSHIILSALLFLVQFLIVFWMSFKLRRDTTGFLFVMLLLLEMYVTVMYLSPQKGYLLQGEVLFQITFAAAVYRSMKEVSNRFEPANAPSS